MNKHRHLPHLSLLVLFLMMTTSAAGGQSNTAAGQSNTAAGQSNTAAGQSDTAAGQPDTAPGQSNTAAGQSNTAAGQSNTAAGQSKFAASPFNMAKPGKAVERHLSGDQTFREWSLEPNVADGIKRIKVCRV